MAAEVKLRKDMDKRWQWNLNDIIASDAVFEEKLAEVKAEAAKFAALAGHVKDDPRRAIRDYFASSLAFEKLYSYASMKQDEDGDNSVYQALKARTQSFAVQLESEASFLEPELLLLPEETLEEMLDDPEFKDYETYLRGLIRSKAHTLPAEQEKLLALAGDVIDAPHAAFSMLSDVDIPFPTIKDEEGEEVKLTHARYGTLIRSKDRQVRKNAFLGMMNSYQAFGTTIAALYSGAVKGDEFIAKARKFSSAREMALDPNEIPLSVYDNLIAATHDALPALNRYLALRKKQLGVDELHLYDLYVPLVEGVTMKMSYEEAFELVLSALKPLGEDYLSVLREAQNNHWIDVYENKAKRSGAYSWGCYGVHPFVLLNYEPGLEGASTLAHELGHAMHSHYSDGAQPYAKAGYSLFVAEVASTCNEVLLARYQLEKYKDDQKALAFIMNNLLESFRTTLFRQTLFAEFELRAHAMDEAGEALTKDALNAMNKEINTVYYGGSCVIDDEIAAEWMRIPHFYRAFYVYQYATGFSAAVAIASRILKEGEPAVKDYKRFLSAGGSVPPIEALKYAGVDMSTSEPVKEALKIFEETVAELEALL